MKGCLTITTTYRDRESIWIVIGIMYIIGELWFFDDDSVICRKLPQYHQSVTTMSK